jgi:hypothetical protein
MDTEMKVLFFKMNKPFILYLDHLTLPFIWECYVASNYASYIALGIVWRRSALDNFIQYSSIFDGGLRKS